MVSFDESAVLQSEASPAVPVPAMIEVVAIPVVQVVAVVVIAEIQLNLPL